MGDILDMAIKRFEGKDIFVTGSSAGIGTIVSFIPAVNTTFYFASLNTSTTNYNSESTTLLTLINDTTERARGFSLRSSQIDVSEERWTSIGNTPIGDSLDGDGNKSYKINIVSGTNTISGFLQGWIEDTGTSPQIPTI